MRKSTLLLPALLIVSLAACEDPAKDAPKATVASAAPAASAKAAPKPAASMAMPTAATAAAAGSAAATPTAGEALVVDPATSSVGFVGSKVTGKHEGKFEKFSGSVTLAGGKAEGGKITVELAMDSAKTDDAKLDGHLKSPDFFDVAKFPKATFTSTEIKAGGEKGASNTITGELDLHGVKKTISFPATIAIAADGVTATSEFSINRKDFGIVYPGKTDDLIRDEVLIKLSLKLPRKKG